MDGSTGDAVSLGDLAEALSLLAICKDSLTIDVKRRAADGPAFQTRSPHAGTHSLDDQASLQFGDDADDDDDRPAQWSGGVESLPEGDELDVQPAELIQHF